MEQVDGSRTRAATHILAFEEGAEAFKQGLAEVLVDVEVAQTEPWSFRFNRRDGTTVARILPGIGAAAAELSGEEADKLRRNIRITVCPNERRRLPPFWRRQPPPSDSMPNVAKALAPDRSWCLGAVGLDVDTRTTGAGIKVAVLDTGIELDHPDLVGRVQRGRTAVSFVPDVCVDDEVGHGTACAGIIAGARNSSGGVRYSVASDAALLVGRVFDSFSEAEDEWVLEAIAWAAWQGARVISLSMESERRVGGPYLDCYERLAKRLLDGDPGVLIVAAAGNSGNGSPVANPAACPSIMAAGAVTEKMGLYYRSSTALDDQRVDLVAPGEHVYSAWLTQDWKDYLEGTSMAAPHVAGVAALHLQQEDVSARRLWKV
ncbi:MAG TPA: S8 family serine peptidase, partial [Thermoanaerobaculia bacterium]|nr:S8 family serine peptidase [Thermoanaerobaculia bacterium]